MKRMAFAVFGLLLIVGVLAFALWPLGPRAPAGSSMSSVVAGQEPFARHLELGLLYERNELLEKAQDEYEQAAASEQAEIITAAQSGLERIMVHQRNPWLKIHTTALTLLCWMGENLVRLIIVGAVVWSIWLLVSRLPRRPGYLLLPFEDFTGDNIGQGLHALVNLMLQEAKRTHMRGQDDLLSGSERLEVPLFGTSAEEQDASGNALSALDSFSVGGIDLPLGKILLTIRQWASTREHVITGSLHQYGETLRLGAEIRKATTREVVHAWYLSTVTGEQPADQVVALAGELAFHILFTLCPELEAHTWRSLRLFTAGLRESQRYSADVMDLTVLEKATTLLSEAVVLDPGYTSAHYLLGIVYSNLGRYREARDEFRQVIASGDKLVVEGTYNLGLAFYHEFQDWAYSEAIAQFTEVQEALAEGDRRDKRRKLLSALAHCGLASVYAQRVRLIGGVGGHRSINDQLALVEQHCKEALILACDRKKVKAAAHNALGVAYLKAGQREKAIAELKAAIQANPDYPVAYVYLAEAYANTQPDEAIRLLEQAVRWHPGYEYAHFRLGKIYAERGETKAAKDAYARAPGVPDARNSLGEILAAEGDYEDALAEFREAVKLNRRYARAWRNLAWWTVEAEKQDEDTLLEAAGWARRALEVDRGTPFEWLSHDVLGWILLHGGRLEEAERELVRSVEEQGDQIQNRYHLSCLYYKRGDLEKAKETLAEALKLPGRDYWRDKAVALMQDLHHEAT